MALMINDPGPYINVNKFTHANFGRRYGGRLKWINSGILFSSFWMLL